MNRKKINFSPTQTISGRMGDGLTTFLEAMIKKGCCNRAVIHDVKGDLKANRRMLKDGSHE